MSRSASSRTPRPLVIVSALAMFVFALLFGLALLFGVKVHLDGDINRIVLGVLCIVIGAVIAIGAVLTDREG